ncbi:MAG: RluA family pseudouridine synthase [Firmicutes bacterium]|nr:RluA family pseudouridine synthase [Bacillota bacterium]
MSFYWRAEVEANDDGRLLREVLRGRLGISRRMLHDLKYAGRIALNGQEVTVRARVKKGDIIELHLQETDNDRVQPEPLPLSIVYEDDDLLVVNKQAGMIVHPVPPEPNGTLANAIAWYWAEKGENRPIRIVTRLDRDTSGLVLVAKHALAQHLYTTRPELIDKYYLALVEGAPAPPEGLIDVPIAINPANPVTRMLDPQGRAAQTYYRVTKQLSTISLVQAQLLTGRTHQIRLHLSALGHPIVGDKQYGSSSSLISRQSLHCAGLRLTHLRTQQEFCLHAPLPEDMQAAISQARAL